MDQKTARRAAKLSGEVLREIGILVLVFGSVVPEHATDSRAFTLGIIGLAMIVTGFIIGSRNG